MAPLLAIEFTEQECKVVVAETVRGKTVVRNAFRLTLPRSDDATQRVGERAKALREALAARKIKARRAHVIVPKNYVMARMVTLPSINDDELAGMARFEAERHIPFNAERHVVSHYVLNKLGVEGSQVLLAAIDRPIAQEYIDLCRCAGLTIDSLGVSSLAAFNVCAALAGQQLENKVVALTNLGCTYTDLVIINNGVLSFTRGTSVSVQKLLTEYAQRGRQLTAADLPTLDVLDPRELSPERAADSTGGPRGEDGEGDSSTLVLDPVTSEATLERAGGKSPVAGWLVQLLKEIRRTYEFARREFNCPPISEIQFTGEGALLRNLDRFFAVNFGVEAKVCNPASLFEFAPGLEKEREALGVIYATPLGALAPATPHSVTINLLPPEYIQQMEAKRRRQSYITTGLLSAVGLLLLFVWLYDVFARQSELLELYRQKNREMKERVEDLEMKRKKLEIIRRYIQDKHGALDIIERISSFDFIPDRVTLTRFEYRKDEAVKIEGHAKSLADINRFEAELKKTGIFESVVQDPGSNKPVRLPNRPDPVLQLQMTCTFPKRSVSSAEMSSTKGGSQSKDEASANDLE